MRAMPSPVSNHKPRAQQRICVSAHAQTAKCPHATALPTASQVNRSRLRSKPASAHARARFRIAEQLRSERRPARRIIRRHQNTGLAVVTISGNPPISVATTGSRNSHRLHRRNRRRLDQARQAKHRGGAKYARHLMRAARSPRAVTRGCDIAGEQPTIVSVACGKSRSDLDGTPPAASARPCAPTRSPRTGCAAFRSALELVSDGPGLDVRANHDRRDPRRIAAIAFDQRALRHGAGRRQRSGRPA